MTVHNSKYYMYITLENIFFRSYFFSAFLIDPDPDFSFLDTDFAQIRIRTKGPGTETLF